MKEYIVIKIKSFLFILVALFCNQIFSGEHDVERFDDLEVVCKYARKKYRENLIQEFPGIVGFNNLFNNTTSQQKKIILELFDLFVLNHEASGFVKEKAGLAFRGQALESDPIMLGLDILRYLFYLFQGSSKLKKLIKENLHHTDQTALANIENIKNNKLLLAVRNLNYELDFKTGTLNVFSGGRLALKDKIDQSVLKEVNKIARHNARMWCCDRVVIPGVLVSIALILLVVLNNSSH